MAQRKKRKPHKRRSKRRLARALARIRRLPDQRARRKIEAAWWRAMQKKGWRISYGMVHNPRIRARHASESAGFRAQDRAERQGFNDLRKKLTKAGLIDVPGRFYISRRRRRKTR